LASSRSPQSSSETSTVTPSLCSVWITFICSPVRRPLHAGNHIGSQNTDDDAITPHTMSFEICDPPAHDIWLEPLFRFAIFRLIAPLPEDSLCCRGRNASVTQCNASTCQGCDLQQPAPCGT
jgi:hypothetical protein